MRKFLTSLFHTSRVAQWKRAGPITQRSVDRNYALLSVVKTFFLNIIFDKILLKISEKIQDQCRFHNDISS
jgi:hypothetical protein